MLQLKGFELRGCRVLESPGYTALRKALKAKPGNAVNLKPKTQVLLNPRSQKP